MTRRLFLLILLLGAMTGVAWWLGRRAGGPPSVPPMSVASILQLKAQPEGFARAKAPRRFDFPLDHGPHPDFRTEWWHFVGNLTADDGRRFGYQLTFFRSTLDARPAARTSAWAAHEIFLAHFAVTDGATGRHLTAERWERSALGLAGATAKPFRIWVGPWSAQGSGPETTDHTPPIHLAASAQTDHGLASISLDLTTSMPPVLEGQDGLSIKSSEAGNASYYYSLPRLATRGTVTAGGQGVAVTGITWLDREWSTSALGSQEIGWDWFGLELDDGRSVMMYRLRHRDGSVDRASAATLISPLGVPRPLKSGQFTATPSGVWKSPLGATVYPQSWALTIPLGGLNLRLEPLVANQELDLAFRYWEGAVTVRDPSGRRLGVGYVEMTGYADGLSRAR
jgi:predicted secreted hydrolase